MNSETLEAARAVAFRFLGYSARSQREIERRLAKEEFSAEVIAAVVADFQAQGWLDDTKFAKDWVEDRADRKMYGRTRLGAELRNKGIEKETVKAALDTVDDEAEHKRALEAAQRRWRPERMEEANSEEIQAEKRKLMNFLQRRGFSLRIITQVIKDLMQNTQ